METSHAREGQSKNRAKPSPSVVLAWGHVILAGNLLACLPFPAHVKDSDRHDNREIARWMKLEQCYWAFVVLIVGSYSLKFIL